MNIIVQTTGVDAYSLNRKIESPNNTLSNITRALLLNLGHKKEPWFFFYQYAIWLYHRTENILCGGVPYFLWNITIPSYKHIKIWGARVYFINGRATINKLDDIYHQVYFMGYAATTGVVI